MCRPETAAATFRNPGARRFRAVLAQSLLALLLTAPLAAPGAAQEVVVLAGIDEVVSWLESENWWGEDARAAGLDVPRFLMTGINPAWRDTAQALPVAEKKEVFYRVMLPLIVLANELVLERRQPLLPARELVAAGGSVPAAELAAIREAAVLLRVGSSESIAGLPASGASLLAVIDELLYRLDTIPAGLALGQAAYESGYGTSRFTIEGNALFGQWAYGGQGLVPEQQRTDLGDHRIAAFDWPFDSVRGYFINLMSHPAYEDFRRIRSELRAAGMPLDSLTLADGLSRYSERGQEYVETLKSIIRVNGLDVADGAVFRDEPMRFVVGAHTEIEAAEIRAEIERMRASGELARTIRRMRLE